MEQFTIAHTDPRRREAGARSAVGEKLGVEEPAGVEGPAGIEEPQCRSGNGRRDAHEQLEQPRQSEKNTGSIKYIGEHF